MKFLIAKWWAVREQSENLLKFYRSDTHYEWNATFELVKSTLTCDDYSYEYLEREEIVMDEDSLKSDKSEYLIASPEVNACLEDYWRIEGTGTIAESERLYLDLVVFKLKTHPEVYHCESRSSVLNGCLEGPYFEEAIKNIGLKVG
ncbi:MAG: hypothetical protein H6621_04060 [Halobacteriovoraceae bacterium]|nr:hypothetical protein [Halobacteriovoraceae bacterium]